LYCPASQRPIQGTRSERTQTSIATSPTKSFKADLNRPETLKAAFEGAHGVFLVTNNWKEGTDELKQATAAVRAAKDAVSNTLSVNAA